MTYDEAEALNKRCLERLVEGRELNAEVDRIVNRVVVIKQRQEELLRMTLIDTALLAEAGYWLDYEG